MKFKVFVPKKLLTYRQRFLKAINRSTETIQDTGLKGIQNSIRKRWFRTGNSLSKVTSTVQVKDEGARITFFSGTDYDQFGEYGTGKRGAAKAPSFRPENWAYGSILGMDPRFMFHTGIEEVLPEIKKDFIREVKKAL